MNPSRDDIVEGNGFVVVSIQLLPKKNQDAGFALIVIVALAYCVVLHKGCDRVVMAKLIHSIESTFPAVPLLAVLLCSTNSSKSLESATSTNGSIFEYTNNLNCGIF